MKVVHLIAAARPNFMKIAPLYRALKKTDWCHPIFIRTGQHQGEMADPFMTELGLPRGLCMFGRTPGTTLDVYAERLGSLPKPDAVVVPGDVHGSVGCALAAAHAGVPVVHLEAGLRSFDHSMPEEVNRIVIDSISSLLWTPSEDANANLVAEGHQPRKIVEIGNIMIDAFEMLRPKIVPERREAPYALVTLHRPANVDNVEKLATLIEAIQVLALKMDVVFPVHPRTRRRLQEANLWYAAERMPGIVVLEPQGYVNFMSLVLGATLVVTDSGGVQEETTYLGIPCATLRENTERPITLQGTNRLVTPAELPEAADYALRGAWPKGTVPSLWDGHTADRAVASLKQFLGE